EFLAKYPNSVLPGQRRALTAMKTCRTTRSLRMQAECVACDEQLFVPHSCGHRNCPHCQAHESQQWLERQLAKQVPGEYFMLTFTLPAELRPLAWTQQRVMYALMMQCAWETVRTFSLNDRALQGTPGATAVLHTHTRRMEFHPHVHLLMPAAAIDAKRRLWRTKQSKKPGKHQAGYLFNHKALASVFRAKVLAAITAEGLILPKDYPEKWVVDCKAVGSGEKALVYLGRYLYRGVIQEKDIVSADKGLVTFRYQDSKTRQMEYRTVSGVEFLRLLLQHILPKSFRRARNFGFLHPNSKKLIQLVHYVLKLNTDWALRWIKKRPPLTCRCCGAEMRIVRTRIPVPHQQAYPPNAIVGTQAM
ncbi:MAG: transposase, partial [Sulfuriferula sp.]